ncbi:long-chain-fatty-acid--CoA ligase [Nonomuraea sp. NEAU-L178]|nr:long-chain-fatty-acid--CoA ligase [Nonomuraea aurantiaca]
MGMTISDQLARHARVTPDAVALTFDGVPHTYRRLDERVSRLAGVFAERGVGAGDRVAVMAHNSPEMVEAYFASARIGAICVPLNFRLVADEVAYQLADSGAALVLADARFAPILARTGVDCLVIGEAYEEALRSVSPELEPPTVDPGSPAVIMYTSGTTGSPKGAVLTHDNLLVQTVSKLIHIGHPADARTWLIGTPLFHIAGLAGLYAVVFVGGRAVLGRSAAFDPAQAVDLLEGERVTSCFFVPSQWQAICDLPGIAERDLSALRVVTWGASPASTTLLRRMNELFGHANITTSFGQTETTAVTTILQGRDALRKIGSVGVPMLNVEVRIVDADGHDVPRGQVGEIVYRGPSVMREYWNKPAETAEAFAGGWFHSGDLVRQDDEGYLYVVDRLKDMIISGGENIYCVEVEDVLAAHPKVAEVAVVGAPHEKWGETPLAIVVPADPAAAPTLEEITGWCRERLAAYKCPRLLSVVDALPRNASGKVRKTELRQSVRASSGAG